MYSIFLTQDNGMILGPVSKLLGWILNGLFNFLSTFGIENAGLCIILFTFIVNALMIPLTIKQQKFSKLSAKMNPELTKIQAKYKGKKDEVSMRNQQLETQALYQKYGANPTSGCLPMLITLPILFALYRVIYNIPAYVNSIYKMYETVAIKIQGMDHIDKMKQIAEKFPTLRVDKWEITDKMQVNNIIDVLAQFKSENWDTLQQQFPSIQGIIQDSSEKIIHVNSFIGGLNISDNPTWHNPISLLVPILAIATQFIQTKMMTASTPIDDSNPTAATMKTMNNVMPFVSGIFCMTFPIGIGIYWIAGAVFRIVQQFFVNKYMERIDIEALIEKNAEKAKNKKAKLGIDPNTSLQEYAAKRTSTMKDKASVNVTNNNKKTVNEPSGSENDKGSYTSGSISSIANMLGNKNSSDKGEK